MRNRLLIALSAGLCLAACATTPAATDTETTARAPYASSYTPRPSQPTLLRNATVLDGNGGEFANADVLMRDGRIVAVGQNLDAAGAAVVDASGRFVTPGITVCFKERISKIGCPGLMIFGKFRFSRFPSTCTTSTGFPTTPSSG